MNREIAYSGAHSFHQHVCASQTRSESGRGVRSGACSGAPFGPRCADTSTSWKIVSWLGRARANLEELGGSRQGKSRVKMPVLAQSRCEGAAKSR